ncbi:GNAT family N-acetyltransferase [Iamia sp.]|uniref:GNAT family N-acetyltransferase n=1 Tax=Iamia sp. TaxID=2722710 RepID=UPI002CF0AA18|nr:GNAT family N-acetyltransferase [Iamia sp.]HXH58382.1 GNAT family N-acetyltransferase [Iamia sp.]
MAWPTLITERLVLRPLTFGDLDDLAALHAQESFWWYPFGRGWSRRETQSFLERTIERYRAPGIAVSAVVVAETGELAGWAGLSIPTFLPEVLPAVEVGWRLGEQYRGRGFATEAGAAWLRHGFEDLGLESIVSICEPENVASGAVMRRLGFMLERETTHPTRRVGLHVMSLTRARWRTS